VLSIFEDGIPPVFRIRFEGWSAGAVVPDATTLSVTTLRQPHDVKQVFAFAPMKDAANADFLQSLDSIPEPHEFKATLTLNSASGVEGLTSIYLIRCHNQF